jgi:hypothetical protein
VAIKSIASMGFILSGLFFFIGNEACPDYLGAFTVGGACFGMLGDIVLDLKYTKLNDADRCTNLGFWTFLIGHIFYSIAMVSVYGIELTNIICVAIGIIAGIIIAMVGFGLSMGCMSAYTKFTWFHIPQFRKMIDTELDYRRKYCDFK